MALNITVTPDDIRDAAYGVTIPSGDVVDGQLQRLIAKAILLLPMPCVQRRINDGSLDVSTVESIVEDMVIRVTKNARGFRQRSIDDYSVTLDTALSSGALYLSDDERDRLCPPSRGRVGVGSIRMGIPDYRLPRCRRGV